MCLIIGVALVKLNVFKLLYLYSIHGSVCSFLFPGWEVFRHYCFTYTFCPFLFLSFFCSFRNANTVSFHCVACFWQAFFTLFHSLLSSDWSISNVLPSRSLILSSMWLNLFWNSFEFFSLVFVFFNARISVWWFNFCFCYLMVAVFGGELLLLFMH